MNRREPPVQPYVATATASHVSFADKREEQSASELEWIREELELINYLASHDLMAPLRRMLPCCETLEKQSGSFLDNQGKAALQTFTSEVLRMKTLMQGLLDYLHTETFAPMFAVIDSNEVVASAIADLQANILSAGASVTVGTLPVVYGHNGRLTRLFTSLTDNALKFRGPHPLKIHISASRLAKDWEFSMQDNGIGIEEEYYDIIFRLFQRMGEAYPGEGIGLALCRKIVESHGGRIGVESSLGEGSRFYFTLPAIE